MAVFPVPATFPAHDMSSDPVLPDNPMVSTKMMGGQTSDLRLSAVQTAGEFTATWNYLTLAQLTVFINFWKTVGTWDRFTLPATFWSANCPAARVLLYTGLSPSGNWKFKDKPKWGDFGGHKLDIQFLTITLIGVID